MSHSLSYPHLPPSTGLVGVLSPEGAMSGEINGVKGRQPFRGNGQISSEMPVMKTWESLVTKPNKKTKQVMNKWIALRFVCCFYWVFEIVCIWRCVRNGWCLCSAGFSLVHAMLVADGARQGLTCCFHSRFYCQTVYYSDYARSVCCHELILDLHGFVASGASLCIAKASFFHHPLLHRTHNFCLPLSRTNWRKGLNLNSCGDKKRHSGKLWGGKVASML